ncbi:MAG: bifunctional DNA-formamidopyrimidine glycosylase/DNA-(apurinic or apyrimidinic site) lyase [Candidatus Omnitrophica bacterium]|nr:bifunctional DNA-formamidopyrimidine glycosylase/DNA-(apurinic or apyrimidinic site) lyase [Candidatus Omnitrophota bacterium]
MPELPEVETIKRDLRKIITGKKIIRIDINNPKVIREPAPSAFKKSLEGQAIKNILRRAKLLIFKLSNGLDLAVHLKMTGQLVYPGGSSKSRLAIRFSDGTILDFNDQRLFGELRLVGNWKKLKFVQGLGPEPFDLTFAGFKDMLSKRKTKIKPLLMDQSFVSGIGNIYAAEILFRAKIDPRRTALSLTEKEKQTLYREIKDVLNSAIRHGGSSVDDYVRLSGKPGDYRRFHRVYDRVGKSCFVCRSPIKKITQGGRGTYFCGRCQK